MHDPLAPRRSTFRNLLISMIAFGAVVGVILSPFAHVVLGSDKALEPPFWAMCIGAGLLGGGVNYLLFHVVVSRNIRRLARPSTRPSDRAAPASAPPAAASWS